MPALSILSMPAVIVIDMNGKELWRYDRNEEITTREGTTVWSARQHHDWRRSDFPAGYFSPDAQNGLGIYARATSRVIEINPVTPPPAGAFVLPAD